KGSLPGSQSSCARRSTASLAAIALICLCFRRSELSLGLVTGLAKKVAISFRARGTQFEEGALCSSDSDLLPPRSRYPLKWARNRQPSPPPGRFPGPLFLGHHHHRPGLAGRLSR